MPASYPTYRPRVLADPEPLDPAGLLQLGVQADREVLRRIDLAAEYLNPLDLDAAAVRAAAVAELGAWQRFDGQEFDGQGFATPWVPLLHPDTFSGHKLHIAAAILADAVDATEQVFHACWIAGLGLKAAGQQTIVDRTAKGVTIYLPRRGTLDRDASLVAAALRGYAPDRSRSVPGDRRLGGHLWHRYEFGDVDPGYDVDTYTYRRLYRPATVPPPCRPPCRPPSQRRNPITAAASGSPRPAAAFPPLHQVQPARPARPAATTDASGIAARNVLQGR